MGAIGLKKMAGREDGFLLPWKFSLSKNGDTAYDVAGVIPGGSRKDTLIIFSAHYDHIGTLSNQRAFAFGTTSKRVREIIFLMGPMMTRLALPPCWN